MTAKRLGRHRAGIADFHVDQAQVDGAGGAGVPAVALRHEEIVAQTRRFPTRTTGCRWPAPG